VIEYVAAAAGVDMKILKRTLAAATTFARPLARPGMRT